MIDIECLTVDFDLVDYPDCCIVQSWVECRDQHRGTNNAGLWTWLMKNDIQHLVKFRTAEKKHVVDVLLLVRPENYFLRKGCTTLF